MDIFVTNSSFNKFIELCAFPLDKVPSEYDFIQGYQLQLVPIVTQYFTYQEKQQLVKLDCLMRNFNYCINSFDILQKKEADRWVFPVNRKMSYHANKNCGMLRSSFQNIPIPSEVVSRNQCKEYRNFFHANKNKEELVFAQMLKDRFNLSGDVNKIAFAYIHKIKKNNSGIVIVNFSELSFYEGRDVLIQKFNHLKELIEEYRFTPRDVVCSYYDKTKESLEINTYRRDLHISMLSFYIEHIKKNNILPVEVLKKFGFKSCAVCCDNF